MKTFEEFNNEVPDMDKVWIIGIPSGEALQIKRSDLDILYAQKLVHYNVQYVDTGFFAFKDEDIDDVKFVCNIKEPNVVKSQSKGHHDISIFANDFDPILLDALLGIIDEYPGDIEFYIQDDSFAITYGLGTGIRGMEGDYYIEINMDSHGARYHLTKRYKGQVKDKYNISTDSGLLQRIDHELSH